MCTSFCLKNDSRIIFFIAEYHQILPHHSVRKTCPHGHALQLTCLHVVEMNCIVFVNCQKSPNLHASPTVPPVFYAL